MSEELIVAPLREPGKFRAADGRIVSPPEGWALLPPGDAGLTRRVKAAGPSWTVIEKRRRKKFSHGVWAPAGNIASSRLALEQERAGPAYVRRRAADGKRRAISQAAYVDEFAATLRAFLRFSPAHATTEARLVEAVTAHATPVGSGTVARTQRISVERRAEAAVIAWLRHQTTAYDHMKIARVKGERRRVRQELAQVSRALLDSHRIDQTHPAAACPLCRALAGPAARAM